MPDNVQYKAELRKMMMNMTPEEAKAFQEKIKTLNDPVMDKLVQEFVDAVIAESN